MEKPSIILSVRPTKFASIRSRLILSGTTEWETYEHHKNLPSLPNFQELIDLSKPCFAGAPTIFHVPFDVPADGAFDAPVTEFCFAKPKNAEQKSEVVDLLNSLIKGFDKCYGPALGTTREDSNTIGLVIGWDSVKVRACLFFLLGGLAQILNTIINYWVATGSR